MALTALAEISSGLAIEFRISRFWYRGLVEDRHSSKQRKQGVVPGFTKGPI